MSINIYNDFLSKEELEFMSGRKNKRKIIEWLNTSGIPFILSANGYPVVRRDYNAPIKPKKTEKESIKSVWNPSVLSA